MNIPNPVNIKIFHITHIDNLNSIINEDCIWSDHRRIQRNLGNTNIGYNHIKQRRMRHPVTVAQRGTLGQYVPFNFCPRSVMLYVVNQGHENYSGGQFNVLHLVSSIGDVISANRDWFFTDRHADLGYALQKDNLRDINVLNWAAINARQWADPDIKELKQSEFLVYDYLPWDCIQEIGVVSNKIRLLAQNMINSCTHRPRISVNPAWYY
jgi:hypothetical protein